MASLAEITTETACVIAEPVQAERGVRLPDKEWMKALRRRCDETGAMLILDEIQTGFGRTGSLWAFEQLGIVPDILLLGKALGGGMPLGGFIVARERMLLLTLGPVLGHITTFGGHPVCCAAGKAGMEVLLAESVIGLVEAKAALFRSLMQHPRILELRTAGLIMAVEFDSFETNQRVFTACLENGLVTDWFLFTPQYLRMAPPLIITETDIRKFCSIILEACDRL